MNRLSRIERVRAVSEHIIERVERESSMRASVAALLQPTPHIIERGVDRESSVRACNREGSRDRESSIRASVAALLQKPHILERRQYQSI